MSVHPTLLIDLTTPRHLRIKAVIFTLIRTFELELAVPQQAIVGKSGILQYPMVKDDPTAGAQLPLHIRPFKDR